MKRKAKLGKRRTRSEGKYKEKQNKKVAERALVC